MAGELTFRRWFLTVAVVSVAASVLFIIVLCTGYKPSFIGSIKALFAGGRSYDVLAQIRFPRVLLGFIVGAALSVSGVLLQAVLRNPLAEPFLLGVSSGGVFGATLATLLGGVTLFSRTSAALAGAFIAIGIVYILASSTRFHPFALILTGVAVNAAFSSIVLLLTVMLSEQQLHQTVYFLMGTLGRPLRLESVVAVGLPVLALTVFALFQSNRLNALMLGDESAAAAGVKTKRLRAAVFLTASALAALCVSLTGLIGFVGLVVPHLVRLTFGGDHRLLIPLTALCGGVFLSVCDAAARSLASFALPVGVVTALLGAPLLIFLLWRNAKRRYL